MDIRKSINSQRQRRKFRVRNRLVGTAERPRMCVSRTLTNISVQLVDDHAGRTIVSAATTDKAVREAVKYGGNSAAAAHVGKLVAEKALSAGVKSVTFDRGYCRYHGRVAALADAARQAGLEF